MRPLNYFKGFLFERLYNLKLRWKNKIGKSFFKAIGWHCVKMIN